ncbi:MAG: glycosyltransferase [bacterium]|nr:glycosyltransferase [bacterium]
MDLLMIFVTLGTQDKKFPRLLQALDKAIEKGEIEEKVIVQAGNTKYESENMDIFDLISPDEFNKYIDDCDILITHGGVGSIITAVKKGKKVIAAARLQKYKEHVNDHQLDIIKSFDDAGYIIGLDSVEKLGEALKKVKDFEPKRYIKNTGNILKIVENFIDNN